MPGCHHKERLPVWAAGGIGVGGEGWWGLDGSEEKKKSEWSQGESWAWRWVQRGAFFFFWNLFLRRNLLIRSHKLCSVNLTMCTHAGQCTWEFEFVTVCACSQIQCPGRALTLPFVSVISRHSYHQQGMCPEKKMDNTLSSLAVIVLFLFSLGFPAEPPWH